jgi:hypothetical protein
MFSISDGVISHHPDYDKILRGNLKDLSEIPRRNAVYHPAH